MKDKVQLARIVPKMAEPGGFTPTNGTQVLIGDQPLGGVISVHLHAFRNDVWQASITCYCQPPEVSAGATVEVLAPLSWWRRLLLRIAGVEAIEVTGLSSSAREWARP